MGKNDLNITVDTRCQLRNVKKFSKKFLLFLMVKRFE